MSKRLRLVLREGVHRRDRYKDAVEKHWLQQNTNQVLVQWMAQWMPKNGIENIVINSVHYVTSFSVFRHNYNKTLAYCMFSSSCNDTFIRSACVSYVNL